MFFKKKDSESYDAVTLLDLHYKGTIDDKKFLRMFGKQNVFYTRIASITLIILLFFDAFVLCGLI